MKVKIISIPNNINSAKWHACGGKLYPDGGPIDPPWASFVPSQPREPQVVRPQQQANPYLLGLSAGMGRNEVAKYSTAAQTPEFQQGYYDGRAQVVASEAAKAGRVPIVEPGIEMVSPGLDLSPVGDVRALVDAGEYYQSTGDLKTALGLAALGVVAMPGAGKAADNLRNIIAQKKRLDEALQPGNMRRFLNIGVDPTGSIDYRIPPPEPMPRQVVDKVQPSRKSVARYGKSKYSGPKPTGNKKTTMEDVVELELKPVEQSPEPKQVGNTAKINEDKKQKGKIKGFITRPWKDRSTFRKAFDINAGLGLGTTAVGYGIKGISNLNENASKNIEDIDLNTVPPDSTTISRYREDFINDSLNVEEAYNTAIKLGYNQQLMDSTRKEALDELENRYGRYLNR